MIVKNAVIIQNIKDGFIPCQSPSEIPTFMVINSDKVLLLEYKFFFLFSLTCSTEEF